MTVLDAIFQGIIQGLTEFLPISSSGHLALYQHLTGKNVDNGLLFSVILHLGTLLAIFIIYRKTIKNLFLEFFNAIYDVFTGKFKDNLKQPSRQLLIMLFISCVPLLIIPLFKDGYEGLAANPPLIFEGFCFLFTALLLYLADRCVKGKFQVNYSDTLQGKDKFSVSSKGNYKKALCVGLMQAILAPLPGVSRSGSTISTGLLLGFSRSFAVEYSFILGIPTILGGCIFELSGALEELKTASLLPIVIGFVVSAVIGCLSMKLVSWIVKNDKFKPFIIYTMILGILVILLGIYELVFGVIKF